MNTLSLNDTHMEELFIAYCQVKTPRGRLLVSWPFLHIQSCLGGVIQPVSECKVREIRWILGESTRLRTKLEF